MLFTLAVGVLVHGQRPTHPTPPGGGGGFGKCAFPCDSFEDNAQLSVSELP